MTISIWIHGFCHGFVRLLIRQKLIGRMEDLFFIGTDELHGTCFDRLRTLGGITKDEDRLAKLGASS